MKNKITTGQKILIAILLTILIAATILGLYAWAKYITSIPGETTVQVAKWYFDITNLDGTSLSETDPIGLAETIDFAHVKSDRVAPGTYGKIEVVVDSTGTEVSYIYDLAFTVENCPKNLNFYSLGSIVEKSESTINGKRIARFTISRYVPADKANGTFPEKIYWDWPYETTGELAQSIYDGYDMADEGKDVSIKLVATGTEVLQAPDPEDIPEVEDKVVLENVGTDENEILKFVGYDEKEETGTELALQNLNWKEFYKDNKGNTYLILDDYLSNQTEVLVDGETKPVNLINNVINLVGLDNSGNTPYYVYSTGSSRADLLDKLGNIDKPGENTDKWKYLLPKELQKNANIVVAGSPTLDVWAASWNTKYGEAQRLYTRHQKNSEGASKIEGILISTNSTISDTDYSVDGLATTDRLYFPYAVMEKYCQGYWLASPAANGNNLVVYVKFDGSMLGTGYGASLGIRPIVRIPTDIYEIRSKTMSE